MLQYSSPLVLRVILSSGRKLGIREEKRKLKI